MTDNSFYRGKRVLVTGHTGFKGSWLSIWLIHLGAEVCGYALDPYTPLDNFVVSGLEKRMRHVVGDVRSFPDLSRVFRTFQPEIVFHLAAQPIVRRSYLDPKDTFDINVGGTVNVLDCCRGTDSVAVMVMVTSDKCYENLGGLWGHRENDPLGGRDPYSASKAACEMVCRAYLESFFRGDGGGLNGKGLASVRSGNVIGGGDWQEDRLIPDCVRSLQNGKPVVLRNPDAIRPWQHVLDPLHGYLMVAEKLAEDPLTFSTAWNFGPGSAERLTVREIAALVIEQWGDGTLEVKVNGQAPHESHTLCLDTTKAHLLLGWNPRWDIRQSVTETIDWYRRYPSVDGFGFCERQIHRYSRTP